jgi:hypothetical protein
LIVGIVVYIRLLRVVVTMIRAQALVSNFYDTNLRFFYPPWIYMTNPTAIIADKHIPIYEAGGGDMLVGQIDEGHRW